MAYNICNFNAYWSVSLVLSDIELNSDITADGNTFGGALQTLWQNYCDEMNAIPDDKYPVIELAGYYECGNELREFCFRVNSMSELNTMMHYCFAKGRITVADLMAYACTDANTPEHYADNNVDLPLSAFTTGSTFNKEATA